MAALPQDNGSYSFFPQWERWESSLLASGTKFATLLLCWCIYTHPSYSKARCPSCLDACKLTGRVWWEQERTPSIFLQVSKRIRRWRPPPPPYQEAGGGSSRKWFNRCCKYHKAEILKGWKASAIKKRLANIYQDTSTLITTYMYFYKIRVTKLTLNLTETGWEPACGSRSQIQSEATYFKTILAISQQGWLRNLYIRHLFVFSNQVSTFSICFHQTPIPEAQCREYVG